MANGPPWTEEGDRLAIRLYTEGYNCGAIAKAVSRIMHQVSADAVNNRLLRIGVYKAKPANHRELIEDMMRLMENLIALHPQDAKRKSDMIKRAKEYLKCA